MRKRNNIFFGDSYYALFATNTYNRLISRKWFTYADVMADFMNLNSANELPCNVSKCDRYGELKKAFPDVLDVIKDKLGNNCIEESGNNRNKRYRYIGNDKDPLADMRNAKVVNDLKQYWQFCQDSAGFFPTSWIEYFFNGCQDILDIKNRRQKGEQVLSSSLDRVLTNIEFLPFLYECIKNKNVLSVQYKPFEDELQEFTFHPHLLKEYNGRWFLFGHAEGQTPEFGYNLALDRIAKRPNKLSIRTYISAPKNFYNDFFKNIIGVSHYDTQEVKKITIRAHTKKIFKLMETKPIHRSYTIETEYGIHEDGEYGDFSINIECNKEFIARILQMGEGLEIISPIEIRDEFKRIIYEMMKHYNQ